MRFEPTQSELNALDEMDEFERLQYFLTRTSEAEEVWAVADAQGWILHEENDRVILRLWPYKQLATEYSKTTNAKVDATSLDHFVHSLLEHMMKENIDLELLPTLSSRGVYITAAMLSEKYTSLMDAGDYYLEG